jgi:putative flippase GtrA
MINQFFNKQFAVFLLAGGIAAGINFGSRFIYSIFFDFNTSILFSFFTGLICGYILNKMIVFKGSGNPKAKEICYYIVVNGLALAQTWIITLLTANVILIDLESKANREAIAHLAGVVFPVFSSYLGHKYFTFRSL